MPLPATEPGRPSAPVPDDVIDLWLARLPGRASDADRSLLDAAERERAARRVDPRDADRFISAHAYTRRVLARYAGQEPHELRIHAGPGGKPELVGAAPAGLHWNLSHSGDFALVAVAASPVGVDVEVDRRFDQLEALARRCLTPGEFDAWQALEEAQRTPSFLRAWTRKEAVLKCVGAGVAIAPATVHCGLGPGAAIVDLDWEGRAHRLAVHTLDGAWGLWLALASAVAPHGNDVAAPRWRTPGGPAAGDGPRAGPR